MTRPGFVALLLAASCSAPPLVAVEVATGRLHSCARLADGSVQCWGDNRGGQLGIGTMSDQPTLERVTVRGLSGSTRLVLGANHACVLMADQTVRCWGSNTYGQLGDGTTQNRGSVAPVAGLSGAVSIAAGGDVTCAILGDGSARCWGQITDALQPQGASASATPWMPVPTEIPGMAGVTSISVGGQGTVCGLERSGAILCWGFNGNAEVGDGTVGTYGDRVIEADFYRRTARRALGISSATQVSLGFAHGCARLGDGAVRCWGHNAAAQVGTGGDSMAPISQPTAVAALGGASGVSAGERVSCALLADRSVSCWGAVLGATGLAPTPRAIPDLTDVEQLSVGHHHACARLSSGAVRCWGDNASGQLGDGTTTTRSTSAPVL